MKVVELLEDDGKWDASPKKLLVARALMSLQKNNQKIKVALRDIVIVKNKNTKNNIDVPDQHWDVTKIEEKKSISGVSTRIHNTSPEAWFELLPNDDKNLTIKHFEKEGFWLLTSKDGRGIKV